MNRFNLCEERWIPIPESSRVSLMDIFSDHSPRQILGNAIQKLAIYKLLFAIAQRACPIKDYYEYKNLKIGDLANKCRNYLHDWQDRFYLYGDNPFLQVPKLRELNIPESPIYQIDIPDVFSEENNNSLMRESETNTSISDADKAILLLTLMNYATGGKRVSKDPKTKKGVSLSESYQKSVSAKAGPSLGGFEGYESSMIIGLTVLETIYLNLFDRETLRQMPGVLDFEAVPPWERMPLKEDGDYEKNHFMKSIWPWYISVSRYVLLTDRGILYAEGLQFPSKVKDGYFEPYISISIREKDKKAKYVNTDKKPWRSLPSLLETVFEGNENSFRCVAITELIERAKNTGISKFGIFTGGLKVRCNSGDQSVKQSDDYLESQIFFEADMFDKLFYERLKLEFETLDEYSKALRKAVYGYYSNYNPETGKTSQSVSDDYITSIGQRFWHYCDSVSEKIINSCFNDSNGDMNKLLWTKVLEVYNQSCPAESPSQIIKNIKCKPVLRRKDG